MGGEQSGEDKALLARLNAIRPSMVSLEADPNLLPALKSESEDTPEDLIARFQKLHGNTSNGSSLEQSATPPSSNDKAPSPTIEDLLAEIGADEDYKVDESELKQANDLLAEAKKALPSSERPTGSRSYNKETIDVTDESKRPGSEEQGPNEENEAEVAASLAKILDESRHEEQTQIEPDAAGAKEPSHPPVDPSPPSDPAPSIQFPTVPAHSALDQLILPSAPTNVPGAVQSRRKPGAATDEEIDTWCIICCANATVRCFGCDKDLYCWGCWREGHTGEDAGLEERRHVWERWPRPQAKKGG